eukprot:1380563-Amorphochlora_amoeboformis.AAC.1
MIAPARDSLLVPMPEDGWEEVTELRKDEDHHWYCKRQFDSFYQDEAERRWTEAELLRPGDLCETKIFGKWRCGKACAFHVDKSDNMKAVIFMKFEGKLNRIQSTVRVVPKILYTDLGDRCEMFVHKCWVPGVIRDIILPEKINGQRSGRILAKLDIMDELQEGFRMRKPQVLHFKIGFGNMFFTDHLVHPPGRRSEQETKNTEGHTLRGYVRPRAKVEIYQNQ